MRVDVTAEDIEHGVRADCFDCPIARAVTRATHEYVHVTHLRVKLPELHRVADLPTVVLDWIAAYDNGKPVQPFSLELDFYDEEEGGGG